jgi:hypothetical protein
MEKRMATNPKSVDKHKALEDFASALITDINARAARMSPEERAKADRKTIEIAARIRAKSGKR